MGGKDKKKKDSHDEQEKEKKPGLWNRFTTSLGFGPKEPEGYQKPAAPPPNPPDQVFYRYIADSLANFTSASALKSQLAKLDATDAQNVFELVSQAVERKDTWFSDKLGPLSVSVILLQQKIGDPLVSTSAVAVELIWNLWSQFLVSYNPKDVFSPISNCSYDWRRECREAIGQALTMELESKEYRKERLATMVIVCMLFDIQENVFNEALGTSTSLSGRIRHYADKHGLESLVNFNPFLTTLRVLQTERSHRHNKVQVLDVVLGCLAPISSTESLTLVNMLVKEITADGIVSSSSFKLLGAMAVPMAPKIDVEIARWFMAFQDWSRSLDRLIILEAPFVELSTSFITMLLDHEDPTLLGSAFTLLLQNGHISKDTWTQLFLATLNRRKLSESQMERLPQDLQLPMIDKMAPLASSAFQRQHYAKTREGSLGQVLRIIQRNGGAFKVLQNSFEALMKYRDWFKAEDWSMNLLNAPEDEKLIFDTFPFLKDVDATFSNSANIHNAIPHYGPWSPPEILIASLLAKRSVPHWSPDSFVARFQDAVSLLADPSSRRHVPPGLYAVFLCHYLLESLHQFASKDMSAIFDSKRMFKVIPFLQWIEATKKDMAKRAELKHIYDVINERYHMFVTDATTFFNNALITHVTIPQARIIAECTNMNEFMKMFKVTGDINLNATLITQADKEAKASMSLMSSFSSWFHYVGVNFDAEVLEAHHLETKTIADIIETTTAFKQKLADAGFDDTLIISLQAILLPQRSQLFSMIFEDEKSEYVGQKMAPKFLARLVKSACQRLESMFSQDATFGKLEKLWKLVDRLGSVRLKLELNQLHSIVKKSGATIDIDELSAYIEKGAALRLYASGLPKLMQFFTGIPLLVPILPAFGRLDAESNTIMNEVRKVHGQLLNLNDLQVRHISNELEGAKAALRGLEPHTLAFFDEAIQQFNLLRFCIRPDFHDKVGILTGQLQGMAFANKLISSVVSVHAMLSPFLNFTSISAMFKAVHSAIGRLSEEELAIRMQHFELCRTHLTELDQYFSGSTGDSAAAMLPTAIRSLESGRYVVHSSLHPKGYSIILEQFKKGKREGKKHRELETSLEGQNLHGRLRGMTVFLDRSTLKPEEVESLVTFDTCYLRAIAIGNAFEILVKSGHPAFQLRQFEIGRGKADMRVESYDNVLNALLDEAQSWNSQLEEAAVICQRLLFLSPKTTAGFLKKLHRLFTSESTVKDTDWIYQRIVPYLLLCVPEIYRCTSSVPFTPSMVAEAYFSGDHALIAAQVSLAKDDPAKWSDEELYSSLLMQAAQILTSLVSRPDIQALIDASGGDKLGKPRVIKAVDMKPADLFRVVAQASESIPHPSQVLYCSRSLSISDLNRFLDCARHFPTLFYTIYGVNELTHDLRQQLLLWASDAACQPQPTHAQVILLFTAERSGEDMFGFLPTEPANPAGFEFVEKSSAILAARNIASLHCLHQGQGKSSAARQHLASPKRDLSIELSIAEHFRRDKFIHRLSDTIDSNKPLAAKTVSLHLDIKPYAQIEAVSRFLNDWFYFGFVFDPSTGQAFFSAPSGLKPDEPTGLQWHIVVELSSPLAGDADFSHLVPKTADAPPPILNYLPSVFHLKSGSSLPVYQMPVTSDSRLLAGLLQSFASAQFQPSATCGSGLSDAQVQQILSDKWRGITCLRRRRAIIDLMSSAARDFVNLYALLGGQFATQFYNEMLHANPQDASVLLKKMQGSKHLFNMLLAEAEFLSDTTGAAPTVPLIIRKKVPGTLPVFRKGGYDQWEFEMAQIMPTSDWTVVSFSDPDPALQQRSPLPVVFFGRPKIATERSALRGTLRRTLAEALGVENTGKMWSVIEQKRYVLTPHLAHKMLHLHARRRSGNNVILVGDTGQGKTEMVDFYSIFLNMDSPHLPDLLGSLSRLCNDFIRSMYKDPLAIKRPSTEQVNRMEVLKVLLQISKTDKPLAVVLPAPIPLPMASDASLSASASAIPAPGPAAVAPAYKPSEPFLTQAQPEDDHTCWPDLRETLNNWLATMLYQFPLLMRTPDINKLSPPPPPRIVAEEDEEDDGEEDDDEALPLVVPRVDAQVWKKKSLEGILMQILDLKTHDLFHKQLMYRGLSIDEFSSVVKRVIQSAKDWPEMQVLFFVDESNTTSFMGRLKELLVDHRWDNEELPKNVFIVAAINPPNIDRSKGRHDATQAEIDFSRHLNVKTGVRAVSAFDVRPQHPSMEQLHYWFAEMDKEADDDFWEAMIELGASEIGENERRTVIDYVLLGHHQIREALIGNMHPSIRDLVRALTLFKFFRRSTFGAILLQELTMDDARGMESTLPIDALQKEFSAHFWKALFMTVAVGYYFRLLANSATDKLPARRTTLLKSINAKFETEPMERRPRGVHFQSTMNHSLDFLFQHTQIPSAIAPTFALMENLFCTVICVDMKMPLTISGPAGCSKTLSFTIAIDNMRGAGSKKPLYKFCQQMHHYRYQCSPMSSDEEISAVYDDATARQAGLSGSQLSGVREMCTVLLDELNLAEKGSSQPLKVIHGKLDHPKVMTVILTNKLLDPAKTNRTLQVLQSVPSEDDLLLLAKSCLFDERDQRPGLHHMTPLENAIMEGSRQAYSILATREDLSMRYQLRDFVYFLRALRNTCRNDMGVFEMTAPKLTNAIMRNFGGLSDPREQMEVVRIFFNQINQKIDVGTHFIIPPFNQLPTQVLRESINDTIPLHELNPNINSSRYICLLDPSDSCTSVNLLFEMGIVNRSNATIIACSDFEQDATEEGVNERVMKVKDAMSNGDTVVLVAADGIYGNFYDLFNKHFTIVPAENSKPGDAMVTFFSSVAVGSMSRPCKVHPSFKVIVHLPISQLPNTPRPFLSRFEKYVLSIDHCLLEKAAANGLLKTAGYFGGDINAQPSQLDALVEGVQHFYDTIRTRMKGHFSFHGFVDQQTIKSLAMATLGHSHDEILDPVPLPRFLVDGVNDVDPSSIPTRSDSAANWMAHLIRMTNFRLLQIVRPDAAAQFRFLPEEYLREYFLRQEHLSAAHLLRKVLETSSVGEAEISLSPSYSRKWVISARSSDEIARLHNDKPIQELVTSGLKSSVEFLALSTFSSLAALNVKLAAFTASEQDCIVVTADMRTCSTSQINDLRREIDNHLRGHSNRFVFILLHHPPEHAQSPQDAYPAIFWDDWDFYYTDSLGLTSIEAASSLPSFDDGLESDNDDSSSSDSGSDDDAPEARRSGKNSADARAWIAKAVGLEVDISPQSVVRHFKEQFKVEFTASLKLLSNSNSPAARRLKYASRIYTDRNTRQKELLKLIDDYPALVDIILEQFAHYWTDSLLHKIVEGTGDAIRDGKATGAYVPLIQNSLRFMLISVCKQLLDALLGNFNMEGILQVLQELKKPELEATALLKMNFVAASLHLVPPPSIETILEASQVDQNFYSAHEVQRGFKMGKGLVTRLPLFDVVSNVIAQSVSTAMRHAGISTTHENLDAFIHHFGSVLEEQKDLKEVLQFIDAHPALQETFFEDFIQYQLGIPQLTPSLNIVVKNLLRAHVEAIKSRIAIPAVAVFLLGPEVRNAISHVGLCLVPLNSLEPSAEAVEDLIDLETFLNAGPSQMEGAVHTFSVQLLSAGLTPNLDDEEQDEAQRVEKLWKWFISIRDIHVRITSARLQRACTGSVATWYYRMLLLFHTVTSFRLTKNELYALVVADRAAGMNGFLKSQIDDLRSTLLQVEALSKKVAVIRKWDISNSEPFRAGTAQLVQSIVSQAISFDPHTHTKVISASKLVSSIRLFLKMTAQCDLDIPASVKAHLTPQWCLGQLAGLVSKVTSSNDDRNEWFDQLKTLSVETLQSVVPGVYAPFAPFLTSENDIMLEGLFVDAETGVSLTPVRTLVPPLANRVYNPLEIIWFQIFQHLFEFQQMNEDFAKLYEMYNALNNPNPVGNIQRVAVVSCLIKLVANGMSSPKAWKELAAWQKDVVSFLQIVVLMPHTLDECVARGWPADALPYFFSCMKTTESVQSLLGSSQIRQMGLDKGWEVEDVDNMNSRCFRWMNINSPVDHRHHMYNVLTQQLEDDSSPQGLTALLKTIDDLLVADADQHVYDLRMVLVMSLYQNYMSEGERCDVIAQNLAAGSPLVQKLRLSTPLELRAMAFVSNGPLTQVHPRNDVAQNFSKATMDSEGFNDEALLLIMTLAATLGMPPDSNHMWTLAFNTTSVNRYTPMVGSTFKFHADCGFITDFVQGGRAVLASDPSILGNLPRHRLALNASYWSAFTWAFLLDPTVTTTHATNSYNHILNTLPDHSTETCINYTYTRANGFAVALQHVGVDAQKTMDPIFYMSEYLLRLQSCVNRPIGQRNAAWKGQYKAPNYEDLHAYHKALQSEVFIPVDAGLEDRAHTYLDIAAKRGDVLAYVMELRKRPLTHFGLVLPSSSMITTWISEKRIALTLEIQEARKVKKDADLPEQSGQESLLSYVEQFLGMQVPLIANRLIPPMVQYFDALSSVVDGRFTNEELLSSTMREIFEKLRSTKKENDASIDKLYRLTSTFCQNIKLFRALIPILDGCGIVDRVFEYQVDEIDIDKTSPGLLLGIKQEGLGSGNFDRIRAMVKNLVDRHNVCITDRGTVSAIGWNKDEFLFAENNKTSPVIPLHALQQTSQQQTEQNFALITGDVPLMVRFAQAPHRAGGDHGYGGDFNPHNGAMDFGAYREPEAGDLSFMMPFCSPIFSFIASTFDPVSSSCDWMAVGEYIASVYTGGRHELAQLPEWPISERRAISDENGLAAGVHDPARLLSLDYVDQLKHVTSELEGILPGTFKYQNNRNLWKTHLVLDTPTLTAACKHFYQILRMIVLKYGKEPYLAEDALKQGLDKLEKEAKLPAFTAIPHRDSIFRQNGSVLRDLANFLVESFVEYRHFYTEASRVKFAEDFSNEQQHHFSALVRSLDDHPDLEAFNMNLLTLKRILSDELSLKIAEQKNNGAPLIDILADRWGKLSEEFLKSILPDDIRVSHFTTMLRKLEVLVSETRAKLRARIPFASAKDLYFERVPEHFITLAHSMAGIFVPEPTKPNFLPEEDGNHILEQLQEHEIPAPIVVLTEEQRLNDWLFNPLLAQPRFEPQPPPYYDGLAGPPPKRERDAPASSSGLASSRRWTALGPAGAEGSEKAKESSAAPSNEPIAAPSAAPSQPQTQRPAHPAASSPIQAPRSAAASILPFLNEPSQFASPPQASLLSSYAAPLPTFQRPAAYAQGPEPPTKPTPSEKTENHLVFPSVAPAPKPQPIAAPSAAPIATPSSTPKEPLSNPSSLASSSATVSSPALTRSTAALGDSKLLSSYSDRRLPESPVMKDFAQKWREVTKSKALTQLAKELDLSSHGKQVLAGSASQITLDKLVVWAETEATGIGAKISKNGSTYLHVALRVANWNAITIFVEELELKEILPEQLTSGADGQVSTALLALQMFEFAMNFPQLTDDQMWEIISSARLLDLLVVACSVDEVIKAQACALLVTLEQQRPDLRELFEIWHEGPYGSKYDEDFDFVFP